MNTTAAFQDGAELRAALIDATALTRRELKAFLPRFDPRIWDNGALLDKLRAFVTGSAVAHLSICLQDAANARQHASRLMTLCERLPSRCQIRLAHEEHRDLTEHFLLFDHGRYLRRATPLERFWSNETKRPNESDRLGKLFDQVWGEASAHPDLRRLSL